MSLLDELVAANDPTQRHGVFENPNERSWFIRPLWAVTVILAGVALVRRARRRAA